MFKSDIMKNSALLSKLEIPLDMVMFYSVDVIKNIGNRLSSKEHIYELQQYIFLISDNKIKKVFYNIEFLRKNPNLIL